MVGLCKSSLKIGDKNKQPKSQWFFWGVTWLDQPEDFSTWTTLDKLLHTGFWNLNLNFQLENTEFHTRPQPYWKFMLPWELEFSAGILDSVTGMTFDLWLGFSNVNVYSRKSLGGVPGKVRTCWNQAGKVVLWILKHYNYITLWYAMVSSKPSCICDEIGVIP